MVTKMTTMVILKFMIYIVNILVQDIHLEKFTGFLSNIVFFDHFSGGQINDH